MPSLLNVSGTIVPYYKIGNTTVYQGPSDPSLTYTVITGDFWLDTTAKNVKCRDGLTWVTQSLVPSGVTPGTYQKVTVDVNGIVTSGTTLIASDIPSLDASKIISGTFDNNRISQSSVTQHQSSFTILESQITNGSLLARTADNENISGNWNFTQPLVVATPTADNHAVTKVYVDSIALGFDGKLSVRAATITNITLSGIQTIDGVSLIAGDRILVKNQGDATANGIYTVDAGVWSRAINADTNPKVTAGMYTFVEEGTVNADTGWVLSTDNPIVLGTSNLNFVQFSSAGQITAGNGLTKTGNTLDIGTASSSRIVINPDNIDLATVVAPGNYVKPTVDAYGRVTGDGTLLATDIPNLDWAKITSGKPTTLSGYGIIDGTKSGPSTGLWSGGTISINADPTKFDVAQGVAQFVDYTIPDQPVVNTITFGPFTAQTVNNIGTQIATYIGIDSSGNIVQQAGPFSNSQRRTLVSLGLVVHSNLVNINAVNTIASTVRSTTAQLHDLIEAIGPMNLSGNHYTANGANLQLDRSSGTIFKLGSNFHNNPTNPHVLNITGGSAITFRYRLRDGTEYTDVTAINPTQYDLNGVLTTVPNNNDFTVQRINLFQSGLTRIQYGQKLYSTMEDALVGLDSDPFILESNIEQNSIYRAYLIVRKNATSLLNTSTSKLVEVTKFGSVSGSAASGTLTYAGIISALGFTPAQDVHNHSAAEITSGTLLPIRGGTGISSYTTGNYINALDASTLQQRTPAQVLSDIGASPTSHNHDADYVNITGDTMTGDLTINKASATLNVTATTGAGTINVSSQNGSVAPIFLQTNSVRRWTVAKSNDNESGANSGSNFLISRYDDAGTIIGPSISISRATGIADFASTPTVGGINLLTVGSGNSSYLRLDATNGPLTDTLNITHPSASSIIQLNASASAINSILNYSTNGTLRWAIAKDATAETGSNAGSDLSIRRFDDAGVQIDTPVQIARSTGVVNFSQTPTIAGTPLITSSSVTTFDFFTTNQSIPNGRWYVFDTSSGPLTVTLPASPSTGHVVWITRRGSNTLSIDRNGSNIEGLAENGEITTTGLTIILYYKDITEGWIRI